MKDTPFLLTDEGQLYAIKASSLQSLLVSLETAIAIYQTNSTLSSIPCELAHALDDLCLKLGQVKDLDTAISLIKQKQTVINDTP
jgi:hypothetical protein